MRTVREMARVLGWPEARRAPDRVHFPLPRHELQIPNGRIVFERHTPADIRRAFARAYYPHLDVFKGARRWHWQISDPAGNLIDHGHGISWAVALCVGLANLEVASVRSAQ